MKNKWQYNQERRGAKKGKVKKVEEGMTQVQVKEGGGQEEAVATALEKEKARAKSQAGIIGPYQTSFSMGAAR